MNPSNLIQLTTAPGGTFYADTSTNKLYSDAAGTKELTAPAAGTANYAYTYAQQAYNAYTQAKAAGVANPSSPNSYNQYLPNVYSTSAATGSTPSSQTVTTSPTSSQLPSFFSTPSPFQTTPAPQVTQPQTQPTNANINTYGLTTSSANWYQLQQGESIQNYNARIAAANPNLPAPGTTSSTGITNNAPIISSIGSTTSAPTFTGGGSPNFQQATAPQAVSTYLSGVGANLQSQQAQLTGAFQQQQQNYQTQLDALNKQMQDIQTLENAGMAGELSTTSAETAAKQAALQQEQQQYQDNYNANQALINEMDGLLTQGNQIVADMKNTTGLASIMNPRISQTMSDITARTGVIKAVLDARNNQIGVAQKQLTDATTAITSIYKDQMDYYKAVVSFYQDQQKSTQSNIDTLTKDQKDYVDGQITQLQDQIKQTQQTSDLIQKAMLDPTTAALYGRAGVTLNDSVQQINQKLAIAGYAQELSTLTETMAKQGYSSSPMPNSRPVTIVDSQGQSHTFYAPPTAAINKADGTPSTPSSNTGGVIQSGNLTMTQSDIQQGQQILTQSASQGAQADGKYADPNVYLQMFQHWLSQGGKAADFFKQYPYSTYINPSNTWLAQSLTDAQQKGGSSRGAQLP